MGCSNAGVSTRHSREDAKSARDSRNDKCEFTVNKPTESLIVTESGMQREDQTMLMSIIKATIFKDSTIL